VPLDFVCPEFGFRVVEFGGSGEMEKARPGKANPCRNETVVFSSLASVTGCGIARLVVVPDYGFLLRLAALLSVLLLLLWVAFRIARALAPLLERLCSSER
jgi:hypothetical protein